MVYLYPTGPVGAKQTRQGALHLGVDTIGYSPDSNRLVLAGKKGLVDWDATRAFGVRNAERTIATAEPLTGVAVAPGNGRGAAGGSDGAVHLFELTSDKEKDRLEGQGHDGEVRCVALSLDGKTVVSGGVDSAVKVWDVAGIKLRHTLTGHKQ